MADVYKFKIQLKDLEQTIWREMEISSLATISKLGYAVLAAFEATGSHLFDIECKGKVYPIFSEEPVVDDRNPYIVKLSKLELAVGDKLTLKYDYGAGWEFILELIDVQLMKRGTGTHYPYVTDGRGRGIIEDIFPFELLDIIEHIDKTGELPKVLDMSLGCERAWDYRDFNLGTCNMLFKDQVLNIQYTYEEEK